MAAVVRLTEGNVTAEPGSEASCSVRIRNAGPVVDRFAVELVGAARGWTDVEPSVVSLLPGAEDQVVLTFRPPRSSAVGAGSMPFGVKVRSSEDPESSRVEEGELTVQPFTDLGAELIPRTSRGSRTGRHELVVDNNGNHPLTVEIHAADPDRLLDFRIAPALLDLAPGTATFIKLRAQPTRRFLRGDNRTLPFQAFVTAPDVEATTADGAMLQHALLPKSTMKAVALALAVVTALVVLWFTVLKPQVHSEATKAVQQQSAQLSAEANSAKQHAAEAQAQASRAARSAQQAGASPSGGASPTPSGARGAAAGTLENSDSKTAIDFRITTSVAPGRPGSFTTASHDQPKKTVLWITDMVLQNPQGDTGTLQVRRGRIVLFEFGLANFRDLDYHFVQPLRFTRTDRVTLAVDCQNPGATKCTPSAYLDGQLVKG
ncbi:hypothetical protein Asera_60120 [Actinocatenispora sera]|uniref:Hydrolytic protein n=1 Tax=Actinocatenispora sera TaxID=390989 RepID=A0A810L8P7_9ACTN|nr:hypothetical protein Asera_60120 [Actinocatenispora sera]